MTPKNIRKIFIPQKIFNFQKTPKNIEIQNFEPQKMTQAYVCMKISEYPPLGVKCVILVGIRTKLAYEIEGLFATEII